jgi:hypothetical protein
MTRKLTDEQVEYIKEDLKVSCNRCRIRLLQSKVEEDTWHMIVIVKPKHGRDDNRVVRTIWGENNFETSDEAIAYAEHLLNQRYCWLPQQKSWIMSEEVYNLANNGANKVLELMYLAHASDWCDWEEDWYARDVLRLGIGSPTSEEWSKGISIPADSPIWDAVKGAEVQEYTHKEGTTT